MKIDCAKSYYISYVGSSTTATGSEFNFRYPSLKL